MNKEFEPWKCYAKPAKLGGKTCGYQNDKPFVYCGLVCCDGCGSTKRASDLRKEEQESKNAR